jgi:hypothetical protein
LVGAAAASAVAAKVVWGAEPPETEWTLYNGKGGIQLTPWQLPFDRHCYQSHWVALVYPTGRDVLHPKARYYYATNEIPASRLAAQNGEQAIRLIDMVVENGWHTLADELAKIGVCAGKRPEGWPTLQESGSRRRFSRL